MNLQNFNYKNILEDNPLILKGEFISPYDLFINELKNNTNKNTNFKNVFEKYNIQNIISTEHSAFFNLNFKESFIRLFEKRDEKYFKIIINKVLNSEFEDIIIFNVNNKGYNREGNHRLMIARILSFYNIIEKDLKIKVDNTYNIKLRNIINKENYNDKNI